MTTNAGAFEMNRCVDRSRRTRPRQSDGSEAIKRLFSPEFRNRIDAIIQFAPLDMPVIERVVDKLLLEIEAQLEKKSVSIMLDDAARRWLAGEGLRPEDGRARRWRGSWRAGQIVATGGGAAASASSPPAAHRQDRRDEASGKRTQTPRPSRVVETPALTYA